MEKIKLAYKSLVGIGLSSVVFYQDITTDAWIVIGLVEIALMIYLAYEIYKVEAQELKVPAVVLNSSIVASMMGINNLIGPAMLIGLIWMGIKLYERK